MAGRPRKFKTPEDMQVAIDRYFSDCKAQGRPLTISGLAVALDTSRETLINYEKEPGYEAFFDTIKKAKSYILSEQEERLVAGKGNPAGLIFSMKNNYNWKDQQDVSHTIDGVEIIIGKPKAE